MSIGIVSDQEFEAELLDVIPSTSNTPHAVVVEKPSKGRGEGDTNVPESLRQIIGEEAVINGRASALNLAKDLGVSSSSVSAYAVGASSTASYHEPKGSLLNHINKSRERAVKRASKTLNAALSSITQEKLDYTDARDLSGIAKDMSVIIRNLEPQKEVQETSGKSSPQFVIFAPQFRKEESFEIINVSE